MIPRIIHYCWFGHNPKPKLADRCIKSWKKYCKDYEIIEWNEENYDIFSAPLYVRQAYEAGKWAFVTDYVRLQVVYENGGVYFDTDVEVIKKIDGLLMHRAFFGFESEQYINTGLGFGAEKGCEIIKKMMMDYQKIPFLLADGSYDTTPCPVRNSSVFCDSGYQLNNTLQIIDGICCYPKDYFCPKNGVSGDLFLTENSYTIHWFNASWYSPEQKQALKEKLLYLKQEKKRKQRNLRMNRVKNGIKNVIGERNYERLKTIRHRKDN